MDVRVSFRCLLTACAVHSPLRTVCYPLRAICGRGKWLLRVSGPVQQWPCHRIPLRWSPKVLPSLVLHAERFLSLKHFLETSPLRNDGRFWPSDTCRNSVRHHRGFILQTVTSFHRPRLTHYYGIICHLTPLQLRLELPLVAALLASHASPMGELTRPR